MWAQPQGEEQRWSQVESGNLTKFCFFSLGDTTIVGNAEVVSDQGVCPPDEELYPAVGQHASGSAAVTITS